MSHPIAIKQKALEYWEKCQDINKVIQAYGVSRSALYSWKKRQRETGKLTITPKPRPIRKINREELKQYIEQKPDAYLSEIAEYFNCSATAVYYALQSMKITRKKRVQPTKNKTQSKYKHI